MEALIIIDVQIDFIPGGALPVTNGGEVIPVINQLQERFPLVVATQDWHPLNHKSFASNHIGKKPFGQILLNGLDQTLWPDHCVQGAKGAEFHPALNMNKVEAIFRKGMDPEIDSYSGFFDNGHRKSTGLTGYLRARGVDTVYICGLAGDYCVYYTSKDALQEGFKTYVLEDATRSLDQAAFERAAHDIKTKQGNVIHSTVLTHG